MRALGLDPVHDTRDTFRALCDAMSRPGTVQQTPMTPADHAVAATLVDHEVSTYTDDDDLREQLSSQGRLTESQPSEADIVHTHGVPSWDVGELVRGSLVEPSDGATAIYRVESLSTRPEDGLTTIIVSGPGVPDTRTASLGLPAEEIDAIAAAQSTYPRGVDIIFTAADQVVSIPRSVSMEVV
ncbi:MAG: phosphonate C-P lyase system protein PhnH [Halopenitus sp.]